LDYDQYLFLKTFTKFFNTFQLILFCDTKSLDVYFYVGNIPGSERSLYGNYKEHMALLQIPVFI